MTCYYYLEDQHSEFGCTPVSEEDYIMTILRIAGKQGIKIDDKMILGEIKKDWKKEKI